MNGEERRQIDASVHAESVSLREYFEALLLSLEKRLDERASAQEVAVAAALLAAEKAVTAALESAEKAVINARVAQEKVNEKQNEFRQALIDQQSTFMPREAYETAHRDLTRRLDILEADNRQELGTSIGSERASNQRRQTMMAVGPYVAAGIALFIGIVGIIVALKP